mmetsp:Transcript_25398/g.69987  ORF Transcript_25398/g.69987 Transcript_25398/m.69987 type:complete len:338 (+) Transcript_25398:185-1198(+)
MIIGLAWLSVLLLAAPRLAQSFSMANSGNNMGGSSSTNIMCSESDKLDRFRSVFLVGSESKAAVREFDSELWTLLYGTDDDDDDDDDSGGDHDLWVAVYRSNNNQPSVIVRDDFFRAMNEATSGGEETKNKDDATVSTVSSAASFLSNTVPDMLEIPSTKPVAIARLQKSELSSTDSNAYLLDNLRCSLKKEDQDQSCDGGSEFVEALSVAVDTLILNHLQRLLRNQDEENDVVFEGTVRTKSTLFSNKLFEQRGFKEVETLSRDMATHVSNYEACFEQYAGRSIEPSMASGTRDRALQIVALLGGLDPEVQTKALEEDGNGGDDYDPWANMQLYRS